ncbi:hypothetical protein JXA32_06665 [Candidatus Sumerlaeota bacterium]|nr:hypothetical protein [Candidatus Sumerlaeota bacterium]
MSNPENDGYSLAFRLARESERIVDLILHSELEWIDIQFEIERMREQVQEEMPEREGAFERIYESRFIRLWRQWRACAEVWRHGEWR